VVHCRNLLLPTKGQTILWIVFRFVRKQIIVSGVHLVGQQKMDRASSDVVGAVLDWVLPALHPGELAEWQLLPPQYLSRLEMPLSPSSIQIQTGALSALPVLALQHL
jgi:hypothetical protein